MAMCIGSVYGPNIDENILVYDQLQKGVLEMGCEKIILGGDGNLHLGLFSGRHKFRCPRYGHYSQ